MATIKAQHTNYLHSLSQLLTFPFLFRIFEEIKKKKNKMNYTNIKT